MNFLNYLADYFFTNTSIEDLPVEEFEIFDISISENEFEDQEIYTDEENAVTFSLFEIEQAINNDNAVVYLDDTDSSEDDIYYNLEDIDDDFR